MNLPSVFLARSIGGILDVGCGTVFFGTISELKEVRLKSWKDDYMYDIQVKIPDNQAVAAIDCGNDFFAVVTESGNLYLSGNCNKALINKDLRSVTLNEIILRSAVVRMCCGNQYTICQLENHTTVLLCDGVVRATFFYNGLFDIIPAVQLADSFFSLNHGITVFGESCIGNEYVRLLASTLTSSDEDSANPAVLKTNFAELYGQPFLSDITLKLADGDLPAHRAVLSCACDYFKKMFTNNDSLPAVIDVSSYNPKAYRRLVQYFYQAELDVLSADDLTALCNLGHSYGEPSIVRHVLNKLKPIIRPDSVIGVLNKAKSSGNQALIDECAQIINSPAYKEWLIKSASILDLPYILK